MVVRVRRWTGGLWGHPDFRTLWIGQTISVVGSQVTLLALPLVAALTLDASPAEMGLLTAVGWLPDLLLTLFAGVWVDRRRRRPILIWSDVGRAALLASIPLAAFFDVLGMIQLAAVAFGVGALSVLFRVAYGSYLPTVVSRERLVEGNSKLELSRSVAGIVGPGLAGGLVAVLTAPFAMLADAGSFLLSALFLRRIKTAEPAPTPPEAGRNLRRELGEGLRFAFGQPVLRALNISAGTFNFFGSLIGSLYILYVTRVVGIGPGLLGLIGAIGAPGALVGALATGRLIRRFGLGPMMIAGLGLAGLSSFFIPLATGPKAVPFLIGQGLVFGFGAAIYGIATASLTQTMTPDRLLGRVRASGSLVVGGVLPLGALTGGALGEAIGLRPAMTVAATGTLLSAAWLAAPPVRRLREVPRFTDQG